MFPQAVYFPIRTLYLTLKIEQREKHKSAEQVYLANKMQTGGTPTHAVSLISYEFFLLLLLVYQLFNIFFLFSKNLESRNRSSG